MPAKYNGLLDQDHSVEVEKNSLKEKFGLQNLPSSIPTWKPRLSGRWSFDAVRPQFLTIHQHIQKKPIRSTAWLDGLRGFAAFLVCIHHNQLWAHHFLGNEIFETAFGYKGKHYFAQIPFIRLFFAGGHFAVAIFFVISGYVLTYKSLGQIQKGQHLAAADTIGSALFRRWFRLYIPVIGVTLIWLVQSHLFKIWVGFGERKETFGEDLLQWYYSFKNYSFVFLEGNGIPFADAYHLHAWTIPLEMKGSVIVFTAVSAFSRIRKNARLWCEIGLMWYFMYVVDGWYGACFCAGLLLCDLDLLAIDNQLPKFLAALEPFKELIYFHIFVVGIYLAGVPANGLGGGEGVEGYKTLLARSPGWRFLSWFKPQAVFDQKWFYLFWAAFMVVAAIPRLPWLKHFFETRFCQYLARVSFALYLVHGLVMVMLADRLYAAVGFQRPGHEEHLSSWVNFFPITKAGPFGLEPAFWVPQLIIIPVTLYCSELVTRMFDEPSVRISNWFYRQTLQEAQPSAK